MTLIETTRYWAKPGQAQAVRDTRIAASRIRVELGLPAGSIRVRRDDGDGPDVSWSQTFRDEASHAADLRARDQSEEFAAVRARMRDLIDHFERHVEAPIADEDGFAPAPEINLVPARCSFVSAGRQLVGYLYLPPGEGPHPAVVYSHGSSLDRGSAEVASPGVAANFLAWGIALFFPHRHGYGDSPGPSWREEVAEPVFSEAYNRGLLARLDRESDDVVAAAAYLRSLPEIDADRIAVAGSSFGGVNTLFAAGKDASLRAAVEFAGAAMNWDRNPILAEAMLEIARQLTPPIFFAQAANDFSIRPTIELAQARLDAGKPVVSRIYPAFGVRPMEGHLLAGRGPQVWGEDVRRFLGRWL
ncbi:Alpha/beta hydrolase family protein [Devosia enhydra]|uniref:Alpha/beta hydrolase family protein n=1 Tax=Devosia enhydra TaxID=665118 RepID=A0A1K2HY59_9HYPH|nr:dienelactone hydrolase family protein [Devosia enhydra]SFZ84556.1 Alpha/beta hydrolase family protein [Devosia enhydra]